jgi:nucleoside-diphosphate-sugar epimerase
MEGLKVLVTGGTGFVGSNLVRFFLNQGYDVGVLLRKESNTWRLAEVLKDITLVYGDVTQPADVEEAFKKYSPDVVLHTSAYGGYHFEEDEPRAFAINLYGTMNVLKAFERSGSDLFINTGSSSEYGLKDAPMREDDALEPLGAYAISKASATLYCRGRAIEGSLKIFTLRLFSVYGYYEEPHRLMIYALLSALKGEPLKLGRPDPVRDYVFIEDVEQAYLSVIRRAERLAPGEIFNVGTGVETSVGEVVKAVEKIAGRALQVEWGKVEPRLGDRHAHWVADISKTKAALGWSPKYTVEQGLTETYEWLKQNQAKYEVPENAKFRRYS